MAEPLLPLLKESIWKGREFSICRPLMDGKADVPVLAFGYDRPNTFEFLTRDAPRDGAEAEALANLRRLPARWKVARSSGGFLGFGKKPRLLMFDGDFFAAERILDEEFLREGQRLLGAKLLAVAVPARGMILAADAIPQGKQPLEIANFVALVANLHHTSTRDKAPISPIVFTAQDGKLIGFIEAEGAQQVGLASAEKQLQEEDEKLYVKGMLAEKGGRTSLHLLIGSEDVSLLRRAVVPHFLSAIKSVREQPDFGGEVKVIVMDNLTPDGPEVREAISFLNQRLRGIAVESRMETKQGQPFQVTVQYGMVGPN